MTREFTLKNGQTVLIRRTVPEDVEATMAHIDQAAGESDNLTMGPGEWLGTVEKQTAYIERCLTAKNEIFLVAIVDGELAGMINFGGGNRPRNQHVGEFGISVKQKYWGIGIGKLLLQSLMDWAHESGVIRKINLRVRTDNATAIALYEKLGFVKEAHMTRDMIVSGEFVDVYAMGLFVDPVGEVS